MALKGTNRITGISYLLFVLPKALESFLKSFRSFSNTFPRSQSPLSVSITGPSSQVYINTSTLLLLSYCTGQFNSKTADTEPR